MKNLCGFFVALILSCQLSVATAFERHNVAASKVHQAFSHDLTIAHHHHDAFSTLVDTNFSETAHHHVTDNFPSSALLPDFGQLSVISSIKSITTFNPRLPPTVFLDGLLRPPRTTV